MLSKLAQKNLRSSVERGIVYVTENRRMRKHFSNISATKQIVLERMFTLTFFV